LRYEGLVKGKHFAQQVSKNYDDTNVVLSLPGAK
jgi:hypothetical protein